MSWWGAFSGTCTFARGLTTSGTWGRPVRTATLVEPRVTPSALAKRTKIRFAAGSKAMVSFPVMKIPNVGVALALICVVTLAPGGATHAPVVGLVSHTDRLSGRVTPSVLAVAVIDPLLPTLDVATARTPTRAFG